jgi:Spy/CpxP family protein refolding chaperone
MNMKRLAFAGGMTRWVYVLAVAGAALAVSFAALGDVTGEPHDETIASVLEDIRREQGVDENAAIDPDRVGERSLERLGEAVMSVMHPDQRQHELMDEMMGGEGSESLSYMHQRMGYRYLAGLTERGAWGGMMSGPGMMGGYGWGGHGMMGGYGGVWWQRGRGPGDGFMAGGFRKGGAPGLFLGLREELDLSESQVRQLREYRDELIESSSGLRGRLRRAQAGLGDLLAEEPVDLQQVERQVREIESIRTDLHLAAIRAEVHARNILTQRQRQELRSGVGRRYGGRDLDRDSGRRGTGRGMMGGGMMGY